MKSRGIKDPELGSGLAYFVNAAKFGAHLGHHVDEGNVSIFNMFYCLAKLKRSMFTRHATTDRDLWYRVPCREPGEFETFKGF